METMTDTQFDKIIQMVGMILEGCDNLEQAREKIEDLRVKEDKKKDKEK